ncbi:hypothetical protein PF007_g30260 [Phytophthora fragariae]|uniref:Uncharacterized protein n=1 Tax=Phytophthora fragariae TaxID=53985 RepID=A0A6A4B4C9_9STRA|nr:hypothetical protein PF009_g26103 [Phytophthora fragariae]KAE9061425.1 hypothetical protein PF007_g30260 [Phytophthora fragariae]KAE9266861.1 hypothetical protein PF001_g30306 [Phytophthora fragariae]
MISTTQMRSIMLATALLACDMASANAGASAFAGSYTRASVSPDECDAPSDCNYQCSASYASLRRAPP